MKHLILGYVCDHDLPGVTEEDANMLDCINLAFGKVNGKRLDMREMKHIGDLPRIRAWNPKLKFILSVGGWGAGGFSLMSRTEEGRRAFAASCREIADLYRLDGIDIDWEYPCNDSAGIDADPSDRENFTHLLQALRDALGADRVVSIAAGAGSYFIRDTEMEKVAHICDWVQIMTYDIRSGFQKEAGHHTGLFTSPGDRLNGSADASVKAYLAAGVPREKTVIGAAFYSRRWDGLPNENHGLFRMSGTVGQYGPGYTKLEEEFINKNGFTRYWDDDAKAPFLFNGSSLISYDDPESIRCKCEWLKKENLLGIMYWDHGSDPSRKLLRAMSGAMREK